MGECLVSYSMIRMQLSSSIKCRRCDIRAFLQSRDPMPNPHAEKNIEKYTAYNNKNALILLRTQRGGESGLRDPFYAKWDMIIPIMNVRSNFAP